MSILISELNHAHAVHVSTDKKDPQASLVSFYVVPGVNFLEGEREAAWEKVKGHPDVVRMIDEGTFRFVPKAKGAPKGGVPDSLEGHDAKMAIEIAKGTFDAEVLKKWLQNEERETVVAALRAQAKTIAEIDKAREAAQAVA